MPLDSLSCHPCHFYRQTLRLKQTVPGHLILAELDEVPWVRSWWSQILGFLQKLGDLAGDALHAEICETMCMMHGWTPHVAIGQQGLIRCTPVLACSPPSLVRLGWVLSTHTPSGGTWVMHTRGIGLVYMILLTRPPLLAQNLARICAGLLGQAGCLQSPILSFPSRFPSSGD